MDPRPAAVDVERATPRSSRGASSIQWRRSRVAGHREPEVLTRSVVTPLLLSPRRILLSRSMHTSPEMNGRARRPAAAHGARAAAKSASRVRASSISLSSSPALSLDEQKARIQHPGGDNAPRSLRFRSRFSTSPIVSCLLRRRYFVRSLLITMARVQR